jgi:hypothetical protein
VHSTHPAEQTVSQPISGGKPAATAGGVAADRYSYLRARQILVCSTMGKKKPRRKTPLILCFLKRVLNKTKCHGFAVAVVDHPVFHKDQAHVVFIGSVQSSIWPHQALSTRSALTSRSFG